MKKRKTLTRLLCATVSVATVATVGGMALADETDVAEVEETELIVEEQPEEEIEAEAVAEEPEAEVISEEPEEAETPEEEITAEVEVAEDEVIMDVIADEVIELEEVTVSEEVIEVEEETVIFEEAEAGKTGWEKHSDGKWYYYKDGSMYYGWLTLGGKTYYLDESEGYMHVGDARVNGKYFIFGVDGVMLTGWVNFEDYWYYCTPNGAETGWTKIGKNWYYFNPSVLNYNGPYMYSNTVFHNEGNVYYVDLNGVMQTGWAKRVLSDGFNWYYCGSDGHLVSGWQKIDGKWYYFDVSNYAMCTGITYIYNEKTSESDIYFFGQDGVMQTGWVRIYDYKLYFLPSGKAADGWKKIDNKWYFFDAGEAFTGLHSILGESYYFGLPYKADGSVNPDAGVMVTGWLKRGDFSDYGTIVAGWSYFKSNGTMATGWQKIDGKWYYFLPKKYDGMAGYMLTGPNAVYDDAREITQYYCFSSSGAMQTNHWYQTVNHWSYYGSDGTRVSGWQKINGKWYYFSPYMYTGLRYISGILYDFGTDGACVNPPEDS